MPLQMASSAAARALRMEGGAVGLERASLESNLP